ncbi:hypothetical protein LCGC14_1771690 [marine sediment metagenome]|uniref:Uncharacterized protein n=1 Tax=marine sediment metagenome TaxID=412755 RepID=A0A0F9JXR6_9ZZZZ
MENKNESSVAPPNGNGKVSTAELYRALYDLDQGLSRRFTTVLDAINAGRDDLEDHRKNDRHGSDKRVTVAAGGGAIGLLAVIAAIAAKLFGVAV